MSKTSTLLRLYVQLQDARYHRLDLVKSDCTSLAEYREACERVRRLQARFKQVQNARIEEFAENVSHSIRDTSAQEKLVGSICEQSTRAQGRTPDHEADGSGEWL